MTKAKKLITKRTHMHQLVVVVVAVVVVVTVVVVAKS
jgi:hypothetical protein